ncbi:MAG: hypothetical protein HY042_00595 [Spirochaetia bacterium]|nr:hypothetical protein [Spirochaetia bacterium]
MKRNRIIVLAAAVITLLVLAIYFLLKEDRAAKKDQQVVSSQKDPTLPSEIGGAFGDPEEQLEIYRKWAVFPPHSRPLFAGQVDLTNPYDAKSPPVGVVSKPASGCVTGPDGFPKCQKPAEFSDVKCDMTPERAISVGKKDFHVTLRCTNKENVAVPIDGITPKLYTMLFNKPSPSPLPVVGYGDDGANGDEKAGDLTYTFLIRPTGQDWGDMYLEVDMNVKGLRHNQRTSWYSTPQVPAEFRSNFRDQIKDGHLVVSVPVQVFKKGYYHLAANLQESGSDMRFIASSTFEGDLEAGAQTVDFEFFGKIIRDSGIDGPYIVRDVRGKRNNSPVSPSMVKKAMDERREISGNHTEPLWEYLETAPNYKTSRAYKSDEFSKEIWNSEEKQERIKFLKGLAEQKGE